MSHKPPRNLGYSYCPCHAVWMLVACLKFFTNLCVRVCFNEVIA